MSITVRAKLAMQRLQRRAICSIVNTLVTFALPSRNPLMAMWVSEEG